MTRFPCNKAWLFTALCAFALASCATSGAQPHWSAQGKALYESASALPVSLQYGRARTLLGEDGGEDADGDREAKPTPEEVEIAIALLKRAATPVSSTQYIYSPPVGNQQYGSVIPIDTGRGYPGHAGAQYLLGKTYVEGVLTQADIPRGKKWLQRAANQGHDAALTLLLLAGP